MFHIAGGILLAVLVLKMFQLAAWFLRSYSAAMGQVVAEENARLERERNAANTISEIQSYKAAHPGTTEADYLMASDARAAAFKASHPNATLQEVWEHMLAS